jgi:hypothetical protein
MRVVKLGMICFDRLSGSSLVLYIKPAFLGTVLAGFGSMAFLAAPVPQRRDVLQRAFGSNGPLALADWDRISDALGSMPDAPLIVY